MEGRSKIDTLQAGGADGHKAAGTEMVKAPLRIEWISARHIVIRDLVKARVRHAKVTGANGVRDGMGVNPLHFKLSHQLPEKPAMLPGGRSAVEMFVQCKWNGRPD